MTYAKYNVIMRADFNSTIIDEMKNSFWPFSSTKKIATTKQSEETLLRSQNIDEDTSEYSNAASLSIQSVVHDNSASQCSEGKVYMETEIL